MSRAYARQTASLLGRAGRLAVRCVSGVAAQPWLYDRIQVLAGKAICDRYLAAAMSECTPWRRVVDFGGGTGSTKALLAPITQYMCLDLEMPKLKGFLAKEPAGLAICGDGTQMPFRTGDVDLVLMRFVAHHLPQQLFGSALDEIRRILRPGGHFVFFDPVSSDRMVAKLLWHLDRGSYPRNEEVLLAEVSKRFTIGRTWRFRVYHEYILCWAVRASEGCGEVLSVGQKF